MKIINMNRFLTIVAAVGFFATGCSNKTDLIFDKPVDERLTETLTAYQTALTAAPGWKLFVYPQGLNSQDIKVGGLSYYLKFSNTNRVSMVSDFGLDIATTPKESGYRLKALQRPSLIFDTYSYMHIPADPDPDVSFSPAGAGSGWGTDFNFSFTDAVVRDTILLEGNFNKSKAVLIKATQAEMDEAFSGQKLKGIMENTFSYVSGNPYLYFNAAAAQSVSLGFDLDKYILTFTSLDAGVPVNKTMAFSFTTKGIYLQEPVTIGAVTFQEMFWDDTRKIYYLMNGTTRIDIVGSTTAVVRTSLATTLGSVYTDIVVPVTPLPGQSTLFTTRYNTFKTGIKNGGYNLDLDDMYFNFNSATKTMQVQALLYQGGVGPFVALYNYSYTVDATTGNFKFTKLGQNNNGQLILTNANNILSFFNTNNFKIDGIGTSAGFLGLITSIENPTFYFTGNLY